MAAVQILEEFIVWFVTSHWHLLCMHSRLNPCIVSTILQDNVTQLSKLLLTGYQFSIVRIPIEYGGRATWCSISSFVTAGLWTQSGYQGGRVSETKGNALA